MESMPEAQEDLLSDESPKLSNLSLDSNSTVVASPTSIFTPAYRRPVYQRLTSSGDTDARYHGAEGGYPNDEGSGDDTAAQGLAIQNVETARRVSMQRIPIVAKTAPFTPRSTDPVSSPLSSRFSTRSTPLHDGISETSPGDLSYNGSKPSLHEPFVAGTETEHLNKKASASTMMSIEPLGMAILFPTCLPGRLFLSPTLHCPILTNCHKCGVHRRSRIKSALQIPKKCIPRTCQLVSHCNIDPCSIFDNLLRVLGIDSDH